MATAMRGLRVHPQYEDPIGVTKSDDDNSYLKPALLQYFSRASLYTEKPHIFASLTRLSVAFGEGQE